MEDNKQVREENAKLVEENNSLVSGFVSPEVLQTAKLVATSQSLSECEFDYRTRIEEMATKIKVISRSNNYDD